MFNLIKWWNKGGGKVIGYDDDYGDRMDSVSNGKLFALVANVPYRSYRADRHNSSRKGGA